jgi:hypothetical protein
MHGIGFAVFFLSVCKTAAYINQFSRVSVNLAPRIHGVKRYRAQCATTDQPDAKSKVMPLNEFSNIKSKSDNPFHKILRLLSPGEGQSYGNRSQLHLSNARRKFTDPQMWTHIFFVLNGMAAYHSKLYDLLILTSITAPLSVVYHYSYEKPGRLAQMEGTAAKALFTYGLLQIFRAPSFSLVLIESLLLLLTVAIFIGTNLKPHLYESYHCFMHIIPPVWATIVALTHTPLIRLF